MAAPVPAMSGGAPDEPARPQISASPEGPVTPEGPASSHGKRHWYLAAAITAGVALLAGTGAVLLTSSHAPASRPVADDCGLVTCGASLPSSATGQAVRSTAQAAQRRTPAHRARQPVSVVRAHSRAARPPSPRSAPPPPRPAPSRPWHPPAPPRVTVTYTLDGGGWHQGFRAHLTIVNGGRQPIAGWTIQLTLPGDQVTWVGYQGAWQPFAAWQFSGGTLTLHAVSGGETLPPGDTEIVPLLAGGARTAPSGCTFDGACCWR